MTGKHDVRGIIFDMDNTLLRSRIDFGRMKGETYAYLATSGILSEGVELERHTTSTLMDAAVRTGRMSDTMVAEMWDIANRIEREGMHGAMLEPGAAELLRELHGRLPLVIVTNNACEAAALALRENGVLHYFDDVIGRDRVTAMKPEPDASLLVLSLYPEIPAGQWLSVGDSWIDGAAATAAGIRFVAYNGDLARMRAMGVQLYGEISELVQLVDYLD